MFVTPGAGVEQQLRVCARGRGLRLCFMTRAASTAKREQQEVQLPTPEVTWSSLTQRPSCVALHLWDCVPGHPDRSLWMVWTQAQPGIPR